MSGKPTRPLSKLSAFGGFAMQSRSDINPPQKVSLNQRVKGAIQGMFLLKLAIRLAIKLAI